MILIELTIYSTGEKFYINIYHITSIFDLKDHCKVYESSDADNGIEVKETRQQVYSIIEDAKFMERSVIYAQEREGLGGRFDR